MECQPATKGADITVSKICCKDWTRISHSDKSHILHYQFTEQCRDNTLKIMSNSLPSAKPPSCNYNYPSPRKSSIVDSDVLFTSVPLTISSSSNGAESYSQYVKNTSLKASQYDTDTLIASLWDFAGQVIFHNSHSVFISDGGVSVITFNASMELTDEITPREGALQPPECCTIISSIHYWLQVVNSVCSVKQNVLLVGTHIDKLHDNLKKARKIASNKILPVLKKNLCRKPYAKHIAGIDEGIPFALEQSCFCQQQTSR